MSYSSVILADSPALYWRLNESSGTSIGDSSGNSNTGTSNGITLGQPSLLSDGSDTSILMPDAGGTISVYTPFSGAVVADRTFEVLVKRAATTTNDTLFGISGGGGNDTGLYCASGSNDVTWLGASTATTTWTGVFPGTGAVVHAVLTVTAGGILELWFNGVSAGTKTLVGGVGAQPFKLGSHGSFDSDPFNGNMDEAAVYASVLTGTQILAHYNSATSPAVVPFFRPGRMPLGV